MDDVPSGGAAREEDPSSDDEDASDTEATQSLPSVASDTVYGYTPTVEEILAMPVARLRALASIHGIDNVPTNGAGGKRALKLLMVEHFRPNEADQLPRNYRRAVQSAVQSEQSRVGVSKRKGKVGGVARSTHGDADLSMALARWRLAARHRRCVLGSMCREFATQKALAVEYLRTLLLHNEGPPSPEATDDLPPSGADGSVTAEAAAVAADEGGVQLAAADAPDAPVHALAAGDDPDEDADAPAATAEAAPSGCSGCEADCSNASCCTAPKWPRPLRHSGGGGKSRSQREMEKLTATDGWVQPTEAASGRSRRNTHADVVQRASEDMDTDVLQAACILQAAADRQAADAETDVCQAAATDECQAVASDAPAAIIDNPALGEGFATAPAAARRFSQLPLTPVEVDDVLYSIQLARLRHTDPVVMMNDRLFCGLAGLAFP